MHEPIVWIGGWASNLACWRSELETLYPSREHTFLDAHVILEEPGLLPLAAATLPPGGTLVAWSFGSLLLHRSLATEKFRPVCHMISVCPIFDFCREGAPWPLAALSRMIRRIPKHREAVLEEFYAQMLGNSSVTPWQSAAWKHQSAGYSQETLIAGLEALSNVKVANAELPSGNRHTFLASVHDPLSPPSRERFPCSNWMSFPEGHLPFLDYPELFYPLLNHHTSGIPS